MEVGQYRCRCCLISDIATPYHDIYVCADNIHHIAKIKQIESNDELPQQICINCYTELENIFQFILLIQSNDEKLRKELEERKSCNLVTVEENEEDECYLSDEVDMIEEALEGETQDENEMAIMEEYVKDDNVDELQMVEEILVVEEVSQNTEDSEIHTQGDLLEELALVAANRENVHIDRTNEDSKNDITPQYSEDENDGIFLIPYNADEESIHNFKPPKWKCHECKMILRGDVSYEGHMNIHKKLHPHKCCHCRCKFRCRNVLKKHKKNRHENIAPATNTEDHYVQDENTSISSSKCIDCNEEYNTYVELIFHELTVHDNRSNMTACPFCPDVIVDKLLDHLQDFHANINATMNNSRVASAALNDKSWKCNYCVKSFTSQCALKSHIKVCSISNENDENTIQDSDENRIDSLATVHCDTCEKEIMENNWKRHVAGHQKRDKTVEENPTKLLCSHCPREFKNSKTLNQHEKTHQGESPDTTYVCTECGRQYTSLHLLMTHRKQAHKERDNVCQICGNAFKLKNQLVNHMKLHLEKNLQCPHCDKKYARQFDLNVHLRSHTGELPFSCHLCDKSFAIKVRLTYHLQKHYGIKHRCKQCSAEFNSKQKLKAHSFKHTGMPYRCELCDDHGFATRVVFRKHLLRVHHATMTDEALSEMFQRNTGKTTRIKQIQKNPNNDQLMENIKEETISSDQFQCYEDLKQHLSSAHYTLDKALKDIKLKKQKHKKDETIEHKFICKVCGNVFGGQAQLSAHKRLHKERPFKCEQCNKSYPREAELTIHMRTHTGELPFACNLCDKRFAIKVRLTYHLQKHEGVKHCCHYCDAVYDNRNKLRAHLFKHTGMPYKCDLCPDMEFERRHRFATHMQKAHQRILTEDELAAIFAKNTGKTICFKPGENKLITESMPV